MPPIPIRQNGTENRILAASKRFGGYKPEAESQVRESKVKQDQSMSRFSSMLDRFKVIYEYGDDISTERTYEAAGRAVRRARFNRDDIERIVIASERLLEIYEPIKIGLFLSRLMNDGKDEAYMLMMQHFAQGIPAIGAWNTKRLEITGDTYSYLGYCMESGLIHVHGDAKGDWSAGMGMTGGRIIIEGDAEEIIDQAGGEIIIKGCGGSNSSNQIDGVLVLEKGTTGNIGSDMCGGTIICLGDASGWVGHHMRGGEIHVDGNISWLGDIERGKIFYKGKLIVDK